MSDEEVVDGEVVPETTVERRDWKLPPAGTLATARAANRGQLGPGYQISEETDELRREGIPDNTKETKAYQLGRYIAWCGNEALGPPHPREPLDEDPDRAVVTVMDYIRAHWGMTRRDEQGRTVGRGRNGQPYAPDTVRLALAVISNFYQRHGKLPPTHHPEVHETMRGYARRWKRAGYRPDKAHPLSPEEVVAMCRECDRTTAAGIRDAALMRLCGDVGRRNSEMLELTDVDLSWESHDVLLVTFPFGKTNKDDDEDPDTVLVEADVDRIGPDGEVIPAFAPDVCPLKLLGEWLDLRRERGFTSGPIFNAVHSGTRRKDGTASGKILPAKMTRKAFQDIVAKYAKRAVVVDPMTGQKRAVDQDPRSGRKRQIVPHSFRAGMATAAEAAGVPITAVADRGGWARESPVILGYFRQTRARGERNPAVAIRRAATEARTQQSNEARHRRGGMPTPPDEEE